MESNWQTYRLGDIAVIGSSKRVKMADYVSTGVPFYRSKEIIEKHKGNIISTELFISEEQFNAIKERFGVPTVGDILLTSVGTIGVPYQVTNIDRFYFKDGNLTWFKNFNKNINSRYLYFWLTSAIAKRKIDEVTIGSTQQALTIAALNSITIDLPPISLQNEIVKHIESLSKKISLNRQINRTLEQMAQALYKSWFIDFDPVVDNALDAGFFDQELEFSDELLRRAEARRNLRASADFVPLPETVRQQFPAAFELCSEPSLGLRGWVPQAWALTTAGDVFTVTGGSTPSTANSDFWDGGDIHWTTPKDLSGRNDKILLTTERKITLSGLKKITSGLLPTETVLMSSRAPVGYLALTKIPTAINQGYIAITDTKELSPEFTLYWLDSNMDKIKSMSGGTTFAEISKKTFRGIQLIKPSIGTVESFSVIVDSYLSKITKNAEECSTLENLREYLLPKLLAGELEVNS